MLRKEGCCITYNRKDRTEEGSITVFLTIIFLLFFALVGVTFENVRQLSSVGYVRAAAVSAAATLFGEYNRELYEDYGLFGYGGADGKNQEDLESAYQRILMENISGTPANTAEKFTDLYSFRDISVVAEDVTYLTDSDEFLGQIQEYLKQDAIDGLADKMSDGIVPVKDSQLQEKLEMTDDYEKGKYDKKEESDTASKKKEGKQNNKNVESYTADEQKESSTEIEKESLKEDAAGGNPLETFTDLARNGVLNLVCDEKKLSTGVVEPCTLEEDEGWDTKQEKSEDEDGKGKTKAAELLAAFMKGSDTDTNVVEQSVEKTEFLCYANKMFSSYTNDCGRTTKYGLEYLVGGKEEEKDNLAAIVNRLLVIRMLLNFAYVMQDAVLQEKSLATATAIASVIGLPPVISAVQYTILLILSFQEACIDVTALLEGRKVPITKNALNFKMKYEEICLGTKALFQKKASAYPMDDKGMAKLDLTYQQYLWFFLLTTSRKNIEKRSYDLIQYDLREKYNQTFSINTCICRSNYQVLYQVPYVFQNLPYIAKTAYQQEKSNRSLEVRYGYKSK